MKRRKTNQEKVRRAEETALRKQYLSEDDQPALAGEVWERTKQVTKKTATAVGHVTAEVAKEAAGWIDAGLGLIGVPVEDTKPKRNRNPYR